MNILPTPSIIDPKDLIACSLRNSLPCRQAEAFLSPRQTSLWLAGVFSAVNFESIKMNCFETLFAKETLVAEYGERAFTLLPY